MEFLKRPLPAPDSYRKRVAGVLRGSRVTISGYFDNLGVFDVVGVGEETDYFNTTPMWAQNLLLFTPGQDKVRATRDGFLHVYRGDRIEPVHTIAPGNVRFVDPFDYYHTKVRESGWLIAEHEARRCQTMNKLTIERLEEILTDAEAGKKPPFFDYKTYIKVEPGFAGRAVRVIRFGGLDAVVIDFQSRQLVGKSVEDMLTPRKWGVRHPDRFSIVSVST